MGIVKFEVCIFYWLKFSWDYLCIGIAKGNISANFCDGGKMFSWSVKTIGMRLWRKYLNISSVIWVESKKHLYSTLIMNCNLYLVVGKRFATCVT